MKTTKFVINRKPSNLVVPKVVKSKRWEVVRKAISLVQEYTPHSGRVLKEANGDLQMGKGIYRGSRSRAVQWAEPGIYRGRRSRAVQWFVQGRHDPIKNRAGLGRSMQTK